jgi:hypothetical protein
MSQKHILLIVGMHRSGTSALCSVLECCGVTFGSDMLDPMTGVNDEGFWEDATLVQLNEQILKRLGGTWFSLPPDMEHVDWSSEALSDLGEAAQSLLQRGFGSGALQGMKDPRMSLTLPFWLAACEKAGLPVYVCAISRAPLEVARSLQKRDGFPIGYGLRLSAQYRYLLAASAPPGTLHVTFDALLQNSTDVLLALASALPLTLPTEGLAGTVRTELRHHNQRPGDPVLLEADEGKIDQAALQEAIEQAFPSLQLCGEFALCLVERAEQLTHLGGEYSLALDTLKQRDVDVDSLSALHQQALSTIDERDAQLTQRDLDVDSLSALHQEALSTIDERDAQIVEFDRRLAETGEHLSQALDTLRARDEQVQRIMSLPIVGPLLNAMKWMYEKR